MLEGGAPETNRLYPANPNLAAAPRRVYDTPKKLRETGEEFRVHQGGLVYPENHTQSPMPKVPTVAERNTAMQEQHARGRGSDSE